MPRHVLLATLWLLAAALAAEAAGGEIVCTMDYRPACGWKAGRWQTFSNGCVAAREGARRVRMGECRARRR